MNRKARMPFVILRSLPVLCFKGFCFEEVFIYTCKFCILLLLKSFKGRCFWQIKSLFKFKFARSFDSWCAVLLSLLTTSSQCAFQFNVSVILTPSSFPASHVATSSSFVIYIYFLRFVQILQLPGLPARLSNHHVRYQPSFQNKGAQDDTYSWHP
jgi:hypothetical protein